jgi:hypothetical protein
MDKKRLFVIDAATIDAHLRTLLPATMHESASLLAIVLADLAEKRITADEAYTTITWFFSDLLLDST